MSQLNLTVLGGSSPFTVGLIDALVANEQIPVYNITIHGRSPERVRLVANYAKHHLGPRGWRVRTATSLENALEGTDCVIHQIRYGDLQRRRQGELLCNRLGVTADETLGPAALLTAALSLPELRKTCEVLQTCCPNALVLNLTNPLSATTSAMQILGVRNSVGLCELPQITFLEAAAVLKTTPEAPNSIEGFEWSYCGLNHRGFIDSIRHDGIELLPELPRSLGHQTIGGISSHEIARLGALPLKYFKLASDPPQPGGNRAQLLEQLRSVVESELRASIVNSPRSVQQRYMEWYPRSVVPILGALLSDVPSQHMVNVVSADGLVVESKAWVSSNGIVPTPHETSNAIVKAWNSRFSVHERMFVKAMFDPSFESFEATINSDPIVPQSRKSQSIRILHEFWKDQTPIEMDR